MNKLIIALFAIATFMGVESSQEDGTYFLVKCMFASPNMLQVRLNKSQVEDLIKYYEWNNKNTYNFLSHMKDKLKNMWVRNEACAFGWPGEGDFTTAAKTFADGMSEFLHKAHELKSSPYQYLTMTTWRGYDYDPTLHQFNLNN